MSELEIDRPLWCKIAEDTQACQRRVRSWLTHLFFYVRILQNYPGPKTRSGVNTVVARSRKNPDGGGGREVDPGVYDGLGNIWGGHTQGVDRGWRGDWLVWGSAKGY